MIGAVRVPHPIVVLHGGGVALACGLDGQLHAGGLHGFFAGDTRVLSTYRISINGHAWRLLGRSRTGHGSAQWEFQNPFIRDPGGDIPQGGLLLSLRRRVDGVLHDDLRVCAFLGRPAIVRLTILLDADFADIFQVKNRSIPPRLDVRRDPMLSGGILAYEHQGFARALRIKCEPSHSPPVYTGSLIVFELNLQPGAEWRCCLEAVPQIGETSLALSADPHGPEPSLVEPAGGVTIRTQEVLQRPFEQGRRDLHALALRQAEHPPYVAGGVPWFLTLFGRDSLIAGLMAGLDGVWSARGALAALGLRQAKDRDDWRDAEPGKLPHEIRQGQLASLNRIPHAAYYGAHDAPSLYCLALWHTWRWTGDRAILNAHMRTAVAAIQWCETLGDRDGDGLQEYATRSSEGYYNQSWKDAGDAIVHPDGRLAELPLATVELQGYHYAARLAMAELFEELGEREESARMRREADLLRLQVEERFWLEDEQFYALALDGMKREVASISSNPGHLLWCGLPKAARAAAIAPRFVASDLFSGWGLRTLSSKHPAYNPLSYQRGSVWPHDTLLAAAGLSRYGYREEAAQLIQAVLEAATAFEEERLPELFCGLDRSHGLPVPYEEANSPQAWAAASPILAAQLFLGLVPDAPRNRCFLSPWLPEWLPRLELQGLVIGNGRLDVVVSRRGPDTVVDQLNAKELEVIQGSVEAPLWGSPLK